MSDSTPQEPTLQEQIYALQQELIQVREKGGDRTPESAADNRSAECEVLGKLGIAYYQGQQWQEALVTLTEYLNLARELGQQWHEAVAQYYLGFTQQGSGDIWSAVEAFCQAYWLFRQQGQEEFSAQVWQQVNQAADLYVNAKDSDKLNGIFTWQLQVADAWKDAGLKGKILDKIGRIQYNNKAFQDAVISYLEVLEIAEALPDDRRKSLALAWLGCSYRELGQLEQSLECFDRRLVVAQELGDRAAQKETLGWLIDISQGLERRDSTIKYYEVQLGLFRELKEPILEYSCLYDLARFQYHCQQYQEGLSGFEAALKLAETFDDDSQKNDKIANSRYMVADCYRNLGQQQDAISWYEQAVELYLQLGVKDWAEKGLEHLLNLYRELQQAEPEIDCQKKRFQLIQDRGDDITAQSLAYGIGNLYNNRQQFTQALEYYQEALILARKLAQQQNLANAAYMVADCYRNLGQKEAAISGYEQAVELYVEVKETKWALSGLEYLVNLYRELKQDEQVISSYQRRLEIFRETGDRISEYSCLYELAMFQFNSQKYQEALSGFETALQFADTLDEDSGKTYKVANSRYMLGDCYRNLGQQQEAISSYEQAVELYVEVKETKWALSGLDYLVNLYRELKQYDQAIASQQERLKIVKQLGDRISEQSCLYAIGCIYDDQKQWDQAIEYFEPSLKLAKELDGKYQQANAHYMLGWSYRKSKQTEKAIDSYEQAIKLYGEVKDIKWVATASRQLANFYFYDYPIGKSDSIEKAIAIYTENLTIYSRQDFAKDWAKTQDYLGLAYFERIKDDKAENLETAIRHYEAALEVYTREEYPQDWAMVQVNLGGTYRDRIKGEKLENWHRAITCYEAALEVRTREAYPEKWASLQNRLGNIYSDDVPGDKGENLETAIRYYEAALEVYTREEYPQDWAMVQVNLGGTYRDRIKGEKLENWHRAITCYEAALEVRTREADPKNWASLQNRLGNIYSDDVPGDKAENLETAIHCYEAALEVYTREAYPEDWARTQNNLGITYENRIRGGKADNLEKAIAYYNAALEIRTREAYPENWAYTQNSLGSAYENRLRGDKADNLEKAIAYYNAALEIRTREAYPENWAYTQNSLGTAYEHRIRGEKADNLEKGIAAFNAALQVYSREEYPQEWAMLQIHMGNAYTGRIRGEEAENIERGISYYNAALMVYNREENSKEWAMGQMNLGLAYSHRIREDKAENQAISLAFYNAALEVLTRHDFPEYWAKVQLNLGVAYFNRIQGDKAENLEKAIAFDNAALEVLTQEAFPEEWATGQMNLGIHYRKRIKGQKSQNLEIAICIYQKALETLTAYGFPEKNTTALFGLGLTYQEQFIYCNSDRDNRTTALQNAYSAFAQALDTVEYLRGEITSGDEAKRQINEEWNQLYRHMVEVCLELGNYTAAIEYVDRSKARNLVELIATRDAYPQGVIPIEVRERLQQLRLAIFAEDQRLKQDPSQDYSYIHQLRQEFQNKSPYHPLSFAKIKPLLDEETAILEWYILGYERDFSRNKFPFITFTLTNQTLNLWHSSEKDLQNLIDWTNAYINDYRHNKTQWHNNLPQRLEQLAQILHLDEILHNLREKFPNCKKLILIPHRFLHLFPLHALPVHLPSSPNPLLPEGEKGANFPSSPLSPLGRGAGGEGQLLQELFPKGVAYAPNCQVLQQAQKRINQRPDFNQLFAIQNPTQDLDFTDIEVAAIQSLFNPHQVLKHDQAEKAAILDGDNLKNAHCTHFSCHGYFNFEDALKSALLLAKSTFTPPPPPNEDQSRYIPLQNGNLLDLGKCLTIEDILRLDLSNCRLVTLSACETGITDFNSSSDEYIGLPSGFILAGSPNVVCSLWAVNDLSTALLMIRFYQNVKNGETVPLALKQAQIWLRDVTVEGLQQWSSKLTLRPTYRQQFQRFSKMEATAKPFASPYYWAGFCAIGV